jgi:hypothetical protein
MAAVPDPLPQPIYGWIMNVGGKPTQPFAQYMAKLDACVRALAGGLFGTPTQLVNAANDGAAAAAGVAIGGLYRNGSVVQIRVT